MENILLIVDDEAELLTILSAYLIEEGFEIMTAKDGREALAHILSEKGKNINAILSDLRMPFMDGLTLLSTIRKKNIHTPFILLSAHGDKKAAVDALKLGAYDFLDKPVDRVKMIDSVRNAMLLGLDLKNIPNEIEFMLVKNKVPESQREQARKDINNILIAQYYQNKSSSK